jgi:hypothetical protein
VAKWEASAVSDETSSDHAIETDTYRWIISGVCILLFLIHIGLQLWAGELSRLDPTAIAIALIGLSPWIARILSSAKFAGVELRFLERRVNEQGSDLETLKFLVAHFLSVDELKWLKMFVTMDEFNIRTDRFADEFKAEIRHLRGLGFINHYENMGLRKMYEGPPGERNVHAHFHITDSGRKYLTLRREFVGDV